MYPKPYTSINPIYVYINPKLWNDILTLVRYVLWIILGFLGWTI